ncbi:MAG: NADP-dependent malic enzyme [Defluviitaleaceae bacterium]|nr:NADP-dependent malic enzyme [Defluviitaleaceae bacterium]
MNYASESLKKHHEWRGKIEMISRVPINTREDLSLAYTPGVAAPCLEIQKDVRKSYQLTRRANTVAIVTDGTAVLGLGDIGAEAAMPVMEGKAVLFKELADIDAIPLCLRTKDVAEIVKTISLLAGSFGGINIEDISAPRCFEIERRLKEVCDIPIFHDDQHGTAIVVLSALINALRITKKNLADITVVINGAGAAGIATARLLLDYGVKKMLVCDRQGILNAEQSLNDEQTKLASDRHGSLADALIGADVFIGLSAPNCVTKEMVASMNKDPIVFALANPTPEIMPDLAKAGGAAIVGTGRSDFPNQINNALAFPGVFRGALDVFAPDITEKMKIAAAQAIANHVKDHELTADFIMPNPLDKTLAYAVAKAVGGQND